MRTTRPGPAVPPSEMWVGDYRLLARIGEGGMGVVHLAQAQDGQRVALKVLRPHVIGDDEARERLAREVSSLRRVRSPRVAEVIDADPWGTIPYVATRYVPGLSLHEHLRQEGPVTGADLRHLAAGLAEAVLSVHAVGVLHRDIKPSNVLLEGRTPVLIDFGLARVADDPRLTVTGWLLGTPGYLAPEILHGEDATRASDVHSWAATVAFAATGVPPFGRGPAMAIMDRVRRGDHDLSGVPRDLAPLLTACLHPDPDARPTLAAALADLRPSPRGRALRRTSDEATMPYALATVRDDDPTDVIGHTSRLEEARTVADTVVDGAPPMTGQTHPTAVQQTVGTSYLHPSQAGRHDDLDATPQSEAVARLQRGLLMTGLFAFVVLGFALAPYLSLAAIGVAALVVRTWSWTSEASSDRVWRRGRRRWYDGPLAVVSAPWYLLVATAGTLLLLLWATALAFVTGTGLLLFRVPLEAGLLAMGTVLAVALWWGPGGRRLRAPTRSLAHGLTRWGPVGWVSASALAVAAALVAYGLAAGGVTWDPQPGPPWRDGTVVGDLLALL